MGKRLKGQNLTKNKDTIKEYDIHCESKSYKLELLGKLVVQHDIRALLVGSHVFEPHRIIVSLIY